MIQGKLEVIIKITELPDYTNNSDGWFCFKVQCGDVGATTLRERIVTIMLKPKVWRKLTDAHAAYPQWVASISGSYGYDTTNGDIIDGFALANANVQVFEKKQRPKEDKPLQYAPGAEG